MLRSTASAATRLTLVVVVLLAALSGAASAAPALPDGRAYELVSPVDKNGGDVMSEATRTRAASNGNAVSFASLAGFADIAGTGIAAEYVSRRNGAAGTQGWTTHGIMPVLDPLSFGAAILNLDSVYQGEMADDLSKGVFRTFTGITDAPNVAAVPNLYLRHDLLTPGAGSYELLTDCSLVCVAPLTATNAQPYVADSTPDLGHVLFESTQNLLPGVTGIRSKLYDWDHGTLRLAGVLPNDAVATCPNGQACSFAGANATRSRYTRNTISDDGSRIFFTVPSVNNTNGLTGQLYMRLDHAETIHINASEKRDVDAPQEATFQTATPDGSKVFFTSTEQLTNTPGKGLYVYETTRPDTDPDNLTLVSVDDELGDGGDLAAVIGVSDAGDYAYYFANDQRVAGEELINASGHGIFAWHDGTTSYIGRWPNFEADDTGANHLVQSWNLARLAARVTPGGRYVLFTGHEGEGLLGYDHGNTCSSVSAAGEGPCSELYLYDTDEDELVCASCRPDGAPATGDAEFVAHKNIGGAGATAHLNHPITADGTRVFFDTDEPLVPQDVNDRNDVYQYDVPTGVLHLLSSGKDEAGSFFLDASPSGQDVFFTTREPLVGWDRDNSYDLYDARVGGGFPEPPPPPPAECRGDACQGAAPAPPGAGALPPSASFFDRVDEVTPKRSRARRRCAKGKVRKRVNGRSKCVKKTKRSRVQRRAK